MALCLTCTVFVPAVSAAEPPMVSLGDLKQVTDTTATLQFAVAPGDGEKLEVVVFYGKEDGGEADDAWEKKTAAVEPDKDKGPTEYTVLLEGLQPETGYVYRVKATTSAGTAWSEPGDIRTAAPPKPWHERLLTVVLILVVIVAPIAVGFWWADYLRMPDYGWKLALILAALTWSICIVATMPLKLGIDLSGGVVLVYELEEKGDAPRADVGEQQQQQLTPEEREAAAKVDMDKLVSAIQLRVDPGGTRNVDIRTYGPKQIEVVIPRANPEEVRRIRTRISQAGSLAFRILANPNDPLHKTLIAQADSADANGVVWTSDKSDVLGWWVPVRVGEEKSFPEDGTIVTRRANLHGKRVFEVLVANDLYNVTGQYLTSCRDDLDESGRPCVLFNFNARGGSLFNDFTGLNEPVTTGGQELYRKLGILLDGYLHSAPRIEERISRQGRITGSFTKEEVVELVNVLNAGSLPTALKKYPLFEQESGPTLGRDMIRRGAIAMGLSVLVVFVCMTGYYRFAGLIASAAVVMNLLMLLAVMDVVKGFDLTLPGIAGLVLGVGMAVDANVLIFERMREELARGATIRMAIRNGFDRALSVIIDSNLTGLITAIILYFVGTSQVKGFAVTLGLGIVFSMFTAVFCSRVIFDIGDRRGKIKKLSMMHLIRSTNFDFMGRMSFFGVGLSLLLLVIGMIAVAARGKGLLDIDFTGGESVQVLFKEPRKIDNIRKVLSEARDSNGNELFPDLTVTDTKIAGEPAGKRFIIDTSRQVEEETPGRTATDIVEADLHRIFGEELATNSMTVDSITAIGPASETAPEKSPMSPETPEPAAEATPKAEEPPAPAPKADEPAAPPKSDEPAENSQSSAAQQSLGLLAAADPSDLWLAQADPATDAPEPKADNPPAEPTEADKPAQPAATAPAEDQPAQPAATEPAKSQPAPPAEAPPAEQPAATPPAAQPQAEPAAPARFEGGAQAKLSFNFEMDHESVKELLTGQLAKAQLTAVPFELSNEKYQPGDSQAYREWTLRIRLPQDELMTKVLKPLQDQLANAPFFPSSSSVGGKVAGDMQFKALTALLLSLLCVVIYLWVRFQHVMYGLATVVALVHDVFITLGALAITAYIYPVVDTMKIGLTVLAAFLTIIGYSLNDTIVIFDRIREVKGKLPYITKQTINDSINQTLSRTLLTGSTTLFVLIILFYGGGGLHAFAFTLLVGIIAGTYSSVFVASPVLYWMTGRRTPEPGKKA